MPSMSGSKSKPNPPSEKPRLEAAVLITRSEQLIRDSQEICKKSRELIRQSKQAIANIKKHL